MLYEKSNFVIVAGGNNDYIVWNYNKRWEEGHTHVKSKQRALDLIDNSIDKKFPLHWSNYFIESMIRLAQDKRFIAKLEHLREVRRSKQNHCYRRI